MNGDGNMNIEKFKELLKGFILEKPEKKPKENYVNILVLRELKSAARFTTDGVEANSAVIRIGNIEETVGKLFGRKQVASDRRKAKALQRTLISKEMEEADGTKGWDGCTMKVDEMCQRCPECALFGSAASKEGISITSRVMYDESYTIRAINAIVEEFFQNAPGDNYAKKPTPHSNEPDFFKEGVLFPCVVTLKEVTVEEVLCFLNITHRNSRYGARGTRFGKTRNHILGVYASHREGPSSLEVTRGIALKLAGDVKGDDADQPLDMNANLKQVMYRDTLSVDKVKAAATTVYEELPETHRIEYRTKFDEEAVSDVLNELKDDEIVKSQLVHQIENIKEFVSA